MSEKTVFAVPKDRQNVIIHLDKEIALTGVIFLESFSDDLSVHQKVSAFLENNLVFFPLKLQETGTTEFINKKNIGILEIAIPEVIDTDFFSLDLMHTIPVTAVLCHGDTISGELMAEVPQEKTRLSDCLNLPHKFLSVKTSDKIFYINKSALQKVVYADKQETSLLTKIVSKL